MSKATTENDKSVSTEFVAATFESDLVKKKFGKCFGYFGAGKSDYYTEKINFPENTLIYLNKS